MENEPSKQSKGGRALQDRLRSDPAAKAEYQRKLQEGRKRWWDRMQELARASVEGK